MEAAVTKNRKHWSTSTDHELHEKLKAFSERSRIPVSKLLDEAIEDLLLKHNEIIKKTKTP
ncbi:MAG: ribbon-helix-helix domain-containing protein [Treponema sp.]|nr:ribbon-helix-helix domain-containing protein [Treponema sp.]